MQIHLKTLGCRLNEAELETWTRDFRAQGHSITDRLEAADLVVINTCAVTGEAARKSRKLMHRVRRGNPQAKLVVSGCFASLDKAQIAQSMGADLVVDNPQKDHLVEIASRELALNAVSAQPTLISGRSLLAAGRQRAFIKVQDGCRYQCTFCVVTLARGAERSRPGAEVVEEINTLCQQGIQEVVLSGVHIGGYGSDIGSDLSQLVATVLRETDLPRLRLGAVEPWDLPETFWTLFADPRFMPHLHLPLQSGADSVLRRMARRCKVAEFSRLVTDARQQIPDFNLTTDIIVGFPGETEQEWAQTMAYVEQTGFGHLHIFSYSPRPGTRAASMPNPVPRETIRARSAQLHQLGQTLKRTTLEHFTDRQFPVLLEEKAATEGNVWLGYTPNFLRIAVNAGQQQDDLSNTIRQVRSLGVSPTGDKLTGEPI